MTLQSHELQEITLHVSEHVRLHLKEWLAENMVGQSLSVYELEIRERTLRVEEELRHQREIMKLGFAQNDRRFEEIAKHIGEFRADMNKRFEQVDKRFEQVDKQFEQVDKRFEQVDKRFEQVDKRFEQVDKRLEQMDKRLEQMDKRLEQMDKRFEQVDKRFDLADKRIEELRHDFNARFEKMTGRIDRFMIWSFGVTMTASGLIVTIMKLWH